MLVGGLKRPAASAFPLLGPWAAVQRSPATLLERDVETDVDRERPSQPPAAPLC